MWREYIRRFEVSPPRAVNRWRGYCGTHQLPFWARVGAALARQRQKKSLSRFPPRGRRLRSYFLLPSFSPRLVSASGCVTKSLHSLLWWCLAQAYMSSSPLPQRRLSTSFPEELIHSILRTYLRGPSLFIRTTVHATLESWWWPKYGTPS